MGLWVFSTPSSLSPDFTNLTVRIGFMVEKNDRLCNF